MTLTSDFPDLDPAMLKLARQRGAELDRVEPRAVAATYDPASGRVVLRLANGCEFTIPAGLLQGLAGQSDLDLGEIEVLARGRGLSWPRLDADFLVPELLAGLTGTKAWMSQELARRAGSSPSAAKSQAARENGRRGGRPKGVVGGV